MSAPGIDVNVGAYSHAAEILYSCRLLSHTSQLSASVMQTLIPEPSLQNARSPRRFNEPPKAQEDGPGTPQNSSARGPKSTAYGSW